MTKNIDRLLDAVRERRAEYEARQDEVEDARRDYYRAVERLHEAGMPLREIAEALGLSHQRVHQMVGEAQGPSRAGRLARRVARGGTAVLIALALAGGGVILGTQIDGPDDVPVASPDRSRTSSSGTESEAIEEAEAELRKMMSCLDTTLHEKKAGISASFVSPVGEGRISGTLPVETRRIGRDVVVTASCTG